MRVLLGLPDGHVHTEPLQLLQAWKKAPSLDVKDFLSPWKIAHLRALSAYGTVFGKQAGKGVQRSPTSVPESWRVQPNTSSRQQRRSAVIQAILRPLQAILQ